MEVKKVMKELVRERQYGSLSVTLPASPDISKQAKRNEKLRLTVVIELKKNWEMCCRRGME